MVNFIIFQYLYKQFILFTYADEFKSLFYEEALEWSLSNKIQTKLISKKILIKIFKIVTPLGPVNVFFLLLYPWLFDTLPLNFYYGTLNFWFVYIFQIIFLTYGTVLFFAFGILFSSICVYLVNQFRHLNCFFENMTYTNKEEMREGVIRHVFLWR